jgi:hypothetical protein
MKRKYIVRFFLSAVCLLSAASLFMGAKANTQKKGEVHPVSTTPEKTLDIFLTAFIQRDIDAVMAYIPSGEGDQNKEWRDQTRTNALEHMTNKRHVKSIIGIQLEKIENRRAGKIAHIISKIEISPDFFGAGINVKDSEGKSRAIFKWKFRQVNDQGPWFYDEGGF